jgi:Skp family chaperone for outer membrane proteins
LSSRQRKLTNDLIKQIREVVQEISRKGNYDIVIDKTVGGVMFAKKTVGITDQVIELYDKKKK